MGETHESECSTIKESEREGGSLEALRTRQYSARQMDIPLAEKGNSGRQTDLVLKRFKSQS